MSRNHGIEYGSTGASEEKNAIVADALKEHDRKQAEFPKQKADPKKVRVLREVLDTLANVGQTGTQFTEDERADVLRSFGEDTKGLPEKLRTKLRTVAGDMLSRIGAGDREGARRVARELAFNLSDEVPSTFTPDRVDTADVLSSIPRA
jgi:hypothetical protein